MALKGIKVIEIAGLAPVPFAGLILSDFGAEVIRIDRSESRFNPDSLSRGKRSIALDLKKAEDKGIFLKLIDQADVLIEPFRPGVLEKLGLGPDILSARNPRLVIARLTGFGQTGPYSKMAGHDINYIAVGGALSIIGRHKENPMFPSNMLGDFAAGGLLCALGILLAIIERQKSGKGQVVDAAMVDGSAYLASFIFNMMTAGGWVERGLNLLDSGAHFYETYETKDGKYLAVGAIERQFYRELLKGLGLEGDKSLPSQMDQSAWPEMKKKFAQIFASKTSDEWTKIFDGTDACVTPILDFQDLPHHPHATARKLLIPSSDPNTFEAAPAPRLSRTPALPDGKAPARPEVGEHTTQILQELGLSATEISNFLSKSKL